MLGNLLGGFIIIVVGTSLLPTVADQVFASTHNSTGGSSGVNVTGAAAQVIGLTTLFYSLGIVSAGISITVSGLRNAGVM